MNDTPEDAKPWYQSRTILAGIVGLILSALAAFKIVLPAEWGADQIVNFLMTAIPIVLMIAAHAKSTAVVTTTKAKADVINVKAATDAAVLAASPKN